MGLFSDEGKTGPVSVLGHDLVCPVCGCRQFWQRDTQLNTTGMTFFGLDWANACAVNYVCNDCGYMFWFHPER